MELLKNLKIELTYANNSNLGNISKGNENTNLKRCICSPWLIIGSLFTIAKTWKQPKCPSTDEWIKKLWCIHTVEYCSAIKNEEILPYCQLTTILSTILSIWLKLEGITPNEINQRQTNIVWFHLCVESKNKTKLRMRDQTCDYQRQRVVEKELEEGGQRYNL